MDVGTLLGEVQLGFSPSLFGKRLTTLCLGLFHSHREEDSAGIKFGGEGQGIDPCLYLLGEEDKGGEVSPILLEDEVVNTLT